MNISPQAGSWPTCTEQGPTPGPFFSQHRRQFISITLLASQSNIHVETFHLAGFQDVIKVGLLAVFTGPHDLLQSIARDFDSVQQRDDLGGGITIDAAAGQEIAE